MAEVFPLDINDSVPEETLSSDDDIIEVEVEFNTTGIFLLQQNPF